MPTERINQLITNCHATLASIRSLGVGNPVIVEALADRLRLIETECQTRWDGASDEQKQQWEAQLAALLESLEHIADEGPADPSSEMHKTFASNSRIVGISLFAILGVLFLLIFLITKACTFYSCGMPEAV